MITSQKDYLQHLHLIYNQNSPNYAQVDTNEFIYEINTQTREIGAPTFLGVEKDHRSETIYFKVDRFVNYVDLASTACIIYYVNAKGETGIYLPEFYDIFSYHLDNKILIPWKLDGNVMAKEGLVMFSIRFFKTAINLIAGQPAADPEIIYDLNFLPATSKVLKGIALKEETDYDIFQKPGTWYEEILNYVNEIKNKQQLRWSVIK